MLAGNAADGHAEQAGADSAHHMDADSLQKLVRQLRQTVSAREAQLEGKAQEQARLEDVTQQLMVSVCVHACVSLFC